MSAADEWLALLRVHEGGVTTLGGRFFNLGQPVADGLATMLAELAHTGHLVLGRAVPSGQQRVCVTHAGQVRYAELNSNGVRKGRHGHG